jgi:hypothetical protein
MAGQVEHLYRAVVALANAGRLEIAMAHALLICRFDGVGDPDSGPVMMGYYATA